MYSSILSETKIPYHAKLRNIGYYCHIRHHYIIDNYKNPSMPLRGWFKECNNCFSICGTYKLFNFYNKEIEVPLCRSCIHKLYNNKKIHSFCYDTVKNLYFSN